MLENDDLLTKDTNSKESSDVFSSKFRNILKNNSDDYYFSLGSKDNIDEVDVKHLILPKLRVTIPTQIDFEFNSLDNQVISTPVRKLMKENNFTYFSDINDNNRNNNDVLNNNNNGNNYNNGNNDNKLSIKSPKNANYLKLSPKDLSQINLTFPLDNNNYNDNNNMMMTINKIPSQPNSPKPSYHMNIKRQIEKLIVKN